MSLFICQIIWQREVGQITQREINNKIGGLFVGTAISTCAFLLLAYEWDSKFLVALAFIIAITGACTNFNINYK